MSSQTYTHQAVFENVPYTLPDDELREWRPGARYWVPEAMMTEAGLRADIRALARRGFGAIEVVPANFAPGDFPVERAWRSDAWYDAVRVILSEAAACGMRVDLACGMQWPISAPALASADDPGALYELTWGSCPCGPNGASMALPERRVTHDEGTPQLVAVCAYREMDEGELDERSYVDLTGAVTDGCVPSPGEEYRLFAFWGQPACHTVRGFHVIDHLSEAGVAAVLPQWDELFDRLTPEEAAPLRYVFCDSLEHKVALDWTPDLPEVFQARKGYDLLPYLPVIEVGKTYPTSDAPGWTFQDHELTAAVRRDFCDVLTWCYDERHVRPLAEMAHSHGMGLRYQVAYNKPYQEELAATVPDVPENESLGRPTLDNLRVMAGAAQLTRRERYSFEAACEFENAYGQTQSDLLWWLGRAWACGGNYQVVHGVTYGGASDAPGSEDGMIAGFGWPGYETFGRMLSNYWNRTLSEAAMADLTRGIARINHAASGRHHVDVAVLRNEHLNGGHGSDGAHVVCDGSVLQAHGYTYDFLAPEMLEHGNVRVEGGRLDPEGAAYQALVVPSNTPLSADTMERLAQLAKGGLMVLVMGAALDSGYQGPRRASKADCDGYVAWESARFHLLNARGVREVGDWRRVVQVLDESDLLPDAIPSAPDVLANHLVGPEGDCYLVVRTNAVEYENIATAELAPTTMPALDATEATAQTEAVELSLIGEGVPHLVNPMTGEQTALPHTHEDGRTIVTLDLSLGDVRLVRMGAEATTDNNVATDQSSITLGPWNATVDEFGPADDGSQLFLDSVWRRVGAVSDLENPCWLDELPCVSENFAGRATFSCTLDLDAKPTVALLQLPAFADTVELEVNGMRIPCVPRLTTPDLAPALHEGANRIVLTVSTTLRNRLVEGSHQRFGLGGPARLLTQRDDR